ncbi:MAG: hypothetical protein U5Q44_00300 [Dehalococcoidia bacterium]|nr:hypothetical protein [Dehalococcoidia bacterium]
MSALAFWKAVVQDRSDFLESVIGLFEEHGIRYCVIGGVGVNAYVEPVITQDLDVVVAASDIESARTLLEREFRVQAFRAQPERAGRGLGFAVPGAARPGDGGRAGRRGAPRCAGTAAAGSDARGAGATEDPSATRSGPVAGANASKDAMDIARLVGAQPAELNRS